MKKLSLIVAFLLAFSLVLGACAGNGNLDNDNIDTVPDTGIGGTDDGLAEDVELPTEDDLTTEATEVMEETEVMETEVMETEVIPTEDMVETEVMDETPILDETDDAGDMAVTEVFDDVDYDDPGVATNLLGFPVYNLEDEKIGDVVDLIVNFSDQQVDYALVEVGGFLGIGGKLVAVPFTAFDVQVNETDAMTNEGEDEPENALILDTTQEQVEIAPEFDPETLPEFGDAATDYDMEITTDWMESAMDEDMKEDVMTDTMRESELAGVVLADDLLGMDVRNTSDEDIANIEDFIVDPETGHVRYLAAEIDGIDDLNGEWMLLPLSVFSIDQENDVLVVTVDDATLTGAPTLEDGLLPDTSSTGWDTDVDAYWEEGQ